MQERFRIQGHVAQLLGTQAQLQKVCVGALEIAQLRLAQRRSEQTPDLGAFVAHLAPVLGDADEQLHAESRRVVHVAQ